MSVPHSVALASVLFLGQLQSLAIQQQAMQPGIGTSGLGIGTGNTVTRGGLGIGTAGLVGTGLVNSAPNLGTGISTGTGIGNLGAGMGITGFGAGAGIRSGTSGVGSGIGVGGISGLGTGMGLGTGVGLGTGAGLGTSTGLAANKVGTGLGLSGIGTGTGLGTSGLGGLQTGAASSAQIQQPQVGQTKPFTLQDAPPGRKKRT